MSSTCSLKLATVAISNTNVYFTFFIFINPMGESSQTGDFSLFYFNFLMPKIGEIAMNTFITQTDETIVFPYVQHYRDFNLNSSSEQDLTANILRDVYKIPPMIYENMLYSIMDRLCSDYNGGVWDLVYFADAEGNNVLALFVPDQSKKYLLQSPNGYSAEISAEATAVVANLFALNYLCSRFPDSEILNDKYYLLRNLAALMTENSEIYSLID